MGNLLAGGPVVLVQIVLLVLVVALIVKKAIHLYGGSPPSNEDSDRGLHAILFWGVFCSVLGVYGQLAGIYRALGAIAAATDISPAIIAQGLAMSFLPTLFGLVVMMLAGLAWFVLLGRTRRHTANIA
ncbi:MotA/TolQ/ExbB proton channel family protein [Gemmatimonadota bacterium]